MALQWKPDGNEQEAERYADSYWRRSVLTWSNRTVRADVTGRVMVTVSSRSVPLPGNVTQTSWQPGESKDADPDEDVRSAGRRFRNGLCHAMDLGASGRESRNWQNEIQ